MAWSDLGHQFIALSEPRSQPANDDRQFGLVVDDAIITSSSKNATPTDVETALRGRLGILGVATDSAAVASDERVYEALQRRWTGSTANTCASSRCTT